MTTRHNLVAIERNMQDDAREFGLHMRQGGWRLGLLVARNVKISPGRVTPEALLPKVNATEFARRAATSNDRVIRHYAAWQRAAKAGLVPDADTLLPGTEVSINVDSLPAWGPIYNAPLERTTPRERQTRPAPAPVETRTADPVVAPTSHLRISPDPDDEYVTAATEAARERMAEALDEVRDPTHDPAASADALSAEWTEDVRYAINAMLGHTRRIFDAARDQEWADPVARERAAQDIHGLSKQLQVIAEITADPSRGNVTDDALQALLTP